MNKQFLSSPQKIEQVVSFSFLCLTGFGLYLLFWIIKETKLIDVYSTFGKRGKSG